LASALESTSTTASCSLAISALRRVGAFDRRDGQWGVGRDRAGQLEAAGHQPLGLDDLAKDAQPERLVGTEAACGEQQFGGGRQADLPGEHVDLAERVEPEPGGLAAEPRGVGGDPQVARQQQGQPAADRGAVGGGDHRLADPGRAQQGLLQ
jgi:hypothetical protein